MAGPEAPLEEDLTILMVGDGDPVQEGVGQALARRRATVETSPVVGCAQMAIAIAPDLVLLVGDAADDGGTAVLGRLSASPLAAILPVVLLADDEGIGDQVKAFRFGATAVIKRSASVDNIARRVVDLAREIPERSGQATGELGEATLEDFAAMLTRELRNGIVSVKDPADNNTKVRIVLGEGRAVAEAVEGFVAKVRPLIRSAEVVKWEFQEHAGGTLQLLGADAEMDESVSIDGLRVLLADDDVARADAVGSGLRGRGANVVMIDVGGQRLERARGIDPSVLVIGEDAIAGSGFSLIRRMRDDLRLRWAYLLVVAWDDIWGDETQLPAINALVTRLAQLAKPEHNLATLAHKGKTFDARLEVTGPARMLRVLADSKRSLRLVVSSRRANVQIDLSDGLIAGAAAELTEPRSEGPRKLRGSTALATLLSLGSGRVTVEPSTVPRHANVMAPVDAALSTAQSESSPLRPSRLVEATPEAQLVGAARITPHPNGATISAKTGFTNPGITAPTARKRGNTLKPPAPPPPSVSLGKKPRKRRATSVPPPPPRRARKASARPASAGAKSQPPPPPPRKRKREPTLVGMPVPVGASARPREETTRDFDLPQGRQPTSVPTVRPAPPSAFDAPTTRLRSVPPKAADDPPTAPEVVLPEAIPLTSEATQVDHADEDAITAHQVRLPENLGDAPIPGEDTRTEAPRLSEAPPRAIAEETFHPSGPPSSIPAPMVDASTLPLNDGDGFDDPPPAEPLEPQPTYVTKPQGRSLKWPLLGIAALALGAGIFIAVLLLNDDDPVLATSLDGEADDIATDPEETGNPPETPTPDRDQPDERSTSEGRPPAQTSPRQEEPEPLPPNFLANLVGEEPVAVELPDVPRRIERLTRRQRRIQGRVLRRQASRAMARNQFRRAQELYRNALMYEPEGAENYKGMALALHRRGEQEAGLTWLRRAIQIDDDNADYYVLLGDALGSGGNVRGARAAWDRALELDSRNRAAQRRLARLNRNAGRDG
ncbi:MAG: tetratricopeptide repeat protein [Myxococcota bacterium]